MVPSNEERIAVLEIQQEQLARELKIIRTDVAEIKQAVTSWRGVVLGAVLTVSAIWTAFIGLFQFLKHKVGM